jgi:hypothetical protein
VRSSENLFLALALDRPRDALYRIGRGRIELIGYEGVGQLPAL